MIDPQEVFRVADMKRKLKSPFQFLADPVAWVCAEYGVAKQLVVHEEWVNVPAAFVITGIYYQILEGIGMENS